VEHKIVIWRHCEIFLKLSVDVCEFGPMMDTGWPFTGF
jgi:hypothetical protein